MLRRNSLLLGLLIVCLSMQVNAQKTYSDRAYSKHPYWMEMMEDTMSNFNEVQHAFDVYFSVHELPKEEDEIIGMRSANEEERKEKVNWLKRLFSRRRTLAESELAFAVKKYKHWVMLTEPWVQEDGRILYPFERKQLLDSIRR